MKRLAFVLLVLVVAGSMAFAAGGGEKLVTVGFAQCKADESDWRMANTRSMLDAFNVPGYRLIMADSNNDAAKQVADVQNFIDMEVDYILIAAVNVDGWDTVLRNAQKAKIPVILVDRPINSDESLYLCWFGGDFYSEGKSATDWMEKRFAGKQAGIVNIQGQLGTGAQVLRSKALDDAIAKNSNWTLLARQTGNWSTDTAKQIMASWIRQYGNRINCVYAENDNMADGAIQALREAGIAVGGANGVAIISFDANRAYLQMTLQGIINVNAECSPLHGPSIKKIVDNHRKGIMPKKSESPPEETFFWDTITQDMINARLY